MPYRKPDPRTPAEEMEAGTVYVLHFSKPVGNQAHQQAQHYVGWCATGGLEARLNSHRTKRGAALTKFAVESGAELVLAATYEGVTRDFERRLKGRTHKAHCPICKAAIKELQAAHRARLDARAARRKEVAA